MHEKKEALRRAFYMTTMAMAIDQDQGQGLDPGVNHPEPDQQQHHQGQDQGQGQGQGQEQDFTQNHDHHQNQSTNTFSSKKGEVSLSVPSVANGDSTTLRGGGIAVGSIRVTKKSPRPSIRMAAGRPTTHPLD